MFVILLHADPKERQKINDDQVYEIVQKALEKIEDKDNEGSESSSEASQTSDSSQGNNLTPTQRMPGIPASSGKKRKAEPTPVQEPTSAKRAKTAPRTT